MGTFSFLSRSDRELIDDTSRQAGETERDVEQLVPSGLKDFPAKLTAYDSVTGFYSWTRRAWNSDRTRYDYPTAVQSGTPTSNPARFPNNDVISVSTPVDVWLRPVGINSAVGMVHEVISGIPTVKALTFVTSSNSSFICLSGAGGSTGVSAILNPGEYLFSIVGSIEQNASSDVTGQVTIVPNGNPPFYAYVFCRPVLTNLGQQQGFSSGSFTMRLKIVNQTTITGTMTALYSTYSFGGQFTITVQWSIWQYG